MKKTGFMILFLFNSFFLPAENNLKELFTENAHDWHSLTKQEKISGADSKIIYNIDIKEIPELKNERPYLLSSVINEHLEKNKEIQESDILKYLASGQKFILYDYQPVSIEAKSYRKLKLNSSSIGETSFCAYTEGLKVDGIFTYHIYFIDDNEIYQVWISYKCNESEKKALGDITDIFLYENNTLYWKNKNSRYDFYRLLSSKDINIPDGLIKLQQIYDDICFNLKINGVNVK